MVPADYDYPDKSDSDDREDPSYSQEDEDASRCQPSPQVGGVRTRQQHTQQRKKQNRGSSPETTQREDSAPPSPTSAQESALDRKVRREKSSQSRLDTFHAAESILNDRRNRITSPTPEEDDDDISRLTEFMHHKTRRRCLNRRKPSVVWAHVIKSKKEDLTRCIHCNKTWESLRGSTSNP